MFSVLADKSFPRGILAARTRRGMNRYSQLFVSHPVTMLHHTTPWRHSARRISLKTRLTSHKWYTKLATLVCRDANMTSLPKGTI